LSQEEAGAPSQRFGLIVLFLVIAMNLFDRQLINILAQDIKVDMALTDAELGLLTGTAFGLFKAIFSIPVGAWADRGNKPRILGGLVALSSAFSILSGIAGSFFGLVIARVGVGVGESAGVPVATAIVRDNVPKRATGAIALAMAGNPVGTFLAFLVGGAIADRWGWRFAFFVAGPPGLVLAWILATKLRNVPAERASTAVGSNWIGGTLQLVRKPMLRRLMFATAGSMFMVSAASAWIPAFFIRAHGLGTAQVGLFGAIAIGIGGSIGTLSGIVCDLARPRIRHCESAMMILATLGALPFALLMVFSQNVAAALAAYFIYNVLAYAWPAPTIRLIQDAVEPHQRALALALCSAVGMIAALGIGVPLIGWISDLISARYGLRSIGIALVSVLLIAIAMAFVSHLLVLKALLNSAEPAVVDSDKSARSSDKSLKF